MKKAIIDQILLGILIFVSLIILGATISDNTQARDKYYNLKKITDNAVLTVAKYYVNVDTNINEGIDVYKNMLPKTKLGEEIKDSITFTYDLSVEPAFVIATIPAYEEETFWYKFINLGLFNLNAESKAIIETTNSTETPLSNFSYGIAPFAVNENANFDYLFENNSNENGELELTYKSVKDWDYDDKTAFYPIVPTSLINCDCPYILTDSYDWSGLNFNTSLCSGSNTECSTDGESEFRDYTKEIANFYNSKTSVNFEMDDVASIISLLGTYIGNDSSTWATQMNHLSSGFYDLIDDNYNNLPMQLDIITLNNQGIASGVVRIQINSQSNEDNPGFDFDVTGKPTSQYIKINTTVVGKEVKTVKLVY